MKNKLFRRKSINLLEDVGSGHTSLDKNLTVWDLTSFGIAAIIGAGIFSTIGLACHSGGPAVVFLFVFTAIASGFSAMCYAEFASRVPLSGSAYTYAYVSFGELFAWIIGWALLMEYSIGNIAVAMSWSEYFVGLLSNIGIHIPDWLTIDYPTAKRAFNNGLTDNFSNAYRYAPTLLGQKIVLNAPAIIINIIVTIIVYIGIKESKTASNLMVIFKILVIMAILGIGFLYVDSANWVPFAPNGLYGVMSSVSAVFFAYIGFDAISTTAEECKNPKRDLPRAMIYALIICTILYILLSLVLTGMVPFTSLNVKDPLAFVFNTVGLNWFGGVVAVSAVVAMTSVLLVFQMGQPRIWYAMSRDGLLLKKFSEIHPKFKTPSFATIVTGLVVGVPILFLDFNTVVDFVSISTLFAFMIVCAGVLFLPPIPKSSDRFSIPYFNSRYVMPVILLLVIVMLNIYFPEMANELLAYTQNNKIFTLFGIEFFAYSDKGINNISLIIFFISFIILTTISIIKQYSSIPILGILSCMYLLSSMTITNWIYFLLWMIIGLVGYFLYGYKKSVLVEN